MGREGKAGILLGLSIVVFFGVIGFRSCSKEPPMAVIADELVKARFDQNSDFLSKRFFEEELSELAWDRNRAKRFLDSFLLPKIVGFRLTAIVSKTQTRGGGKEVTEYRFQNREGRESESAVGSYQTESGTKHSLTALLQDIWIIEYRAKHPGPPSPEQPLRAVKEGIVRDYESLKSWGFKHFFNADTGKAYKTLDQAYADAKAWLAANPE